MIHKFLNPLQMLQRTITLDDYDIQCESENGGIEQVVVIQKCDIDQSTVTISDREITAISPKTGKQAYRWTPDLEHAMASDNGTRSSENNSYFRTHSLMVQFTDDEDVTAKLDEDAGRVFLVAFVKYAVPEGDSDKYKAFGFFNGLRLTTSEGPVGQLYEDLRGHTLNFEVKELTRALKIDSSLVEAMLNPPS